MEELTRFIELVRVPVSLFERAKAGVVVVDELVEIVDVGVVGELGPVATDDREAIQEVFGVRARAGRPTRAPC